MTKYVFTKFEKAFAWTLMGLVVIMAIVGIANVLTIVKLIHNKPQIKPCKCPSLQQTLLYVAKYEMFTDSLEYAPKKQRARLTDSLVFYYNALRVNENPINIEK